MHNNKTQFILNQLYRLNPPGRIELTLDRIKRLLKDLGNPEKKLKNVIIVGGTNGKGCLLYTSPSPRDMPRSRMPSSA